MGRGVLEHTYKIRLHTKHIYYPVIKKHDAVLYAYPSNTGRLPNVGTMLTHRCRGFSGRKGPIYCSPNTTRVAPKLAKYNQ